MSKQTVMKRSRGILQRNALYSKQRFRRRMWLKQEKALLDMKSGSLALALIGFLLISSTPALTANAQKLCIKNNIKVKNAKRAVSRRMLSLEEAESCSRGRSEVFDSSSIKPVYTVYEDITSTTSDATSSSTLSSVEEFTSFTKSSADTILKVSYSSAVFIINDSDSAGGADIQIRLNGADAAGNSDSSYDREVSATFTVYDQALNPNAETTKPFTITGVFSGLAAGSYTPSLWLATNDSSRATVNAGSQSSQVLIIEEIETNS